MAEAKCSATENDLGTTISCVDAVVSGKVEVIANEQRNYTTPSYVAFNEHERLIGDAARQQLAVNSANTVIIRARFDHMRADLFRSTITIVEGALKDAGLKSDDIDTIVLVGSSTRSPKIQQILQELFDGKKINETINADEDVAYGAAVQASNEIYKIDGSYTRGVNSNREQIMPSVIERIPVSKNDVRFTLNDNQTAIYFPILQGERHFAKNNFQIGKFIIDGIPAASARTEAATVKFSIDANGILTVAAVSHSNQDAEGKISIKNVCGSLTKAETDQMMADAEMYRDQIKQYYTARTKLEQYCNQVKREYESKNKLISESCDEVLYWLNKCCRSTTTQFSQPRVEMTALIMKVEKEARQYNTGRRNLERYCCQMKRKYGSKDKSVRLKCNEVLNWLNHSHRPSINEFSQQKDELSALIRKIRKEVWHYNTVCSDLHALTLLPEDKDTENEVGVDEVSNDSRDEKENTSIQNKNKWRKLFKRFIK